MQTKRDALLALVFVVVIGGLLAGYPAKAATAATPAPGRTSAQVYSRFCASCHGRNGAANTRKAKANHARNLINAEWQDRVSDERIFNSIMNGKGKMPGYGKKLSEIEINDLVTFVRRLRR